MQNSGLTALDPNRGDSFSEFAGAVCVGSFGNNHHVEVVSKDNYFRGDREFRFTNLPDRWAMDAASDGIGTKAILHSLNNSQDAAAVDLVAMCTMDMIRSGGFPLVLNNVLDVRELGELASDDPEEVAVNVAHRKVLMELGETASREHLVLFKGETAELGVCVGSEIMNDRTAFNLSGTCIGVTHPDKKLSGKLYPGQMIIALHDPGMGANGFTDLRTGLRGQFGKEWWLNHRAREFVKFAAQPCAMYNQLLLYANGWTTFGFEAPVKMDAIIHVTGGSLYGKLFKDHLQRVEGVGAVLDSLFDIPAEMRELAEILGWDDHTFYRKWHGGQRGLIILNRNDAAEFLGMADRYGVLAKVCGEIIASDTPKLEIHSRFTGKVFTYR